MMRSPDPRRARVTPRGAPVASRCARLAPDPRRSRVAPAHRSRVTPARHKTWRLALLATLLILSLSACARAGGEPASYTFTQPLVLKATEPIVQTIQLTTPTLSGIDVVTMELDSSIDPKGILGATVSDLQGHVLGRATTTGDKLATKWTALTFTPPLTIPAYQPNDTAPIATTGADPAVYPANTYPISVAFTWSGTTTMGLGANVTPVGRDEAAHPVHNAYPEGFAAIDGNSIQGDIAFRVRGTGSTGALLSQYATGLGHWLGRIGASTRFMLVWIVALAGAIGLIVWGRTWREDGA